MTTLRLRDGNEEIRFAVGGTSYDSPYLCSTYDLGFPDARVVTNENAGQSGLTDWTLLHNARTVSLTVRVRDLGTKTRHQWLDPLRGMCRPSRRPWLYAQCMGWEQERRILLRGSNLSCVVSPKDRYMVEASLQFSAPSGVFEGIAPTVLSPIYPIQGSPGLALTPGAPTGVALYLTPGGTRGSLDTSGDPVGGHLGTSALSLYPGNGSNVRTFNNPGTAASPALFVINGPCASPRIYNRTSRKQLRFANFSVPANHFAVVDVANRNAWLDGSRSQSIYNRIDWGTSRWFSIEPGENVLEFTTASSDTGCSLVVQYIPRWL